jgi:hypothetical protein
MSVCVAGVFHQPSAKKPGVPKGAADAVTSCTVTCRVGVRQVANPERASGLAPTQPLVSTLLTYLFTFLLTPWSGGLPGKLTCPQLPRNIPLS